MPRPRKLRLTIGTPMTFADLPRGRQSTTRIAAELESAVRKLAPARL
jgi:hypothetical protein